MEKVHLFIIFFPDKDHTSKQILWNYLYFTNVMM